MDGLAQLLVLAGSDGASRHRKLLVDAATEGGGFRLQLGGRLIHSLAPFSRAPDCAHETTQSQALKAELRVP
jgi:hypothetical protein